MRGSRARDRQAREEAEKRVAAQERQQRRAVLQTIETIATTLGETEGRAKEQIVRSVEILGMNEAQEIFEQTQQIEAGGGMLTADGSRRRTPGGVYHFLVKKHLTETGRKAEIKKL
jgi:F0F1-type ATP synthase membrane subunit b/b'